MNADQAFKKFSKGEITLFGLSLVKLGEEFDINEGDTNKIKSARSIFRSRRTFLRKVDDKSWSLLAWQTQATAENAALNELKLAPGTFLVYEFNREEFDEFYKIEQRRGCKLLLEIAES
jgi:hypothetical protein